jgi:hypothetical protein
MGTILTLAAFTGSWWFGRRSLGAGMVIVLVAGYFFGIARANYPDSFTFFLFDASMTGLYLARFTLPGALAPRDARDLTMWTWVLISWPFVVLALGSIFPQHILIQLVGLRAAIWFLPFLLLGASARLDDLTVIARTLAVLNIVVLLFGVGEYVLGLERFYPKNIVTLNSVYRCNDVHDGDIQTYRIPGTFNMPVSYGGTMIATIPFLVSRWLTPRITSRERWLYIMGLLAAALGTFLCASRSPVLYLIPAGAYVAFHLRSKTRYLLPALAIAVCVAYIVAGSDRLQRFTSLQDTTYVEKRVSGSVSVSAMDFLAEYPIGAGLGSAFGTNIPGFLSHLMDKPQIGAESEYVRIGLEQGFVGVGLWFSFFGWLSFRRRVELPPEWKLGGKLMFLFALFCWVQGLIGCGMLAWIPTSALLLFQMGLLARDRPLVVPARRPARGSAGWMPQRRDTMPIPEGA